MDAKINAIRTLPPSRQMIKCHTQRSIVVESYFVQYAHDTLEIT